MTSGESATNSLQFAKVGRLHKSVFNLQIAPVGPAQLLQFLKECRDACLTLPDRRFVKPMSTPIRRARSLLRLRHERPRCRSAAKKRDELAPSHIRP